MNCGKKIAEAAAQVSVNTPCVTCSFCIEAHSAATSVEAFLAVSRAYQGSIKKTGLAIQKKLCSQQCVLGQTKSRGQIVPSARWNHSQNHPRNSNQGV